MFLYMDPQLSAAQFANIVAHELHHVGYASVAERFSAAIADLPPGPHTAAAWMGAFGEGFAMLAAAGGPDVHPHAVSPPEDRARWDRDVANFAQDLVGLDNLFLDIVDGSLAAPDTIRQVAMTFMGRARAVVYRRLEDGRILSDDFQSRRYSARSFTVQNSRSQIGGPMTGGIVRLAPRCALIMAVAVSAGCDQSREASRHASGDTLRVHSNAPVYSRAALREVFSVGAAAGPDEYVFTEMVMFVVGPSGELYIADINGEVRMFDATGRFVRAVGRIGKGPGETQFVVGMAVSNDG